MGSGASQELVEGAAKAGFGTYALIEDERLVEEKVVGCMQKIYTPMRRVKSIVARLQDGSSFDLKTDMHWLENDKQLSLKFLLFDGKRSPASPIE